MHMRFKATEPFIWNHVKWPPGEYIVAPNLDGGVLTFQLHSLADRSNDQLNASQHGRQRSAAHSR
jgi:hypothetical protein